MGVKLKNILVTGAAGFVGKAIADRLHDLGANVVGIVSDLNHKSPWCAEVADITNHDKMRDLVSRYEIDIIYHLAAYSIVKTAAKDPLSTYKVNVLGTVSVLEAARQVGKKGIRVIAASSDKAYGDHEILPYKETFPLLPKNTYDVSKACADLISQSYVGNYGLDVIVTRCSNIYGPGDTNYSRLVPNTIRRCLLGKGYQIYNDVAEMYREFIYIDDVVNAYVLLADYSGNEKVFNIGKNEMTNVGNLAKLIADICQTNLGEVIEREGSFKEIKKQSIDASLLMKETGWEATTDLIDGFSKTVDWHSKLLQECDERIKE